MIQKILLQWGGGGGARNSAISHLATMKNYRDSLGVGGVLIDLLW